MSLKKFFLPELDQEDELVAKRITRILTTDFPMYFAIVTRVRQENQTIGFEGGMLSSTVVPQVQTIFPEGALTKKIPVGLQVCFFIVIIIDICVQYDMG